MAKFSKNQLQRYPIYLRYFRDLEAKGEKYISSPKVAKVLGYSEEQIRKDLQAVCEEPGSPRKGREVSSVIETLEGFLGYKENTESVLIGVGNLGSALLAYPGFPKMGLSIVAAFDSDPAKIGREIDGRKVYPIDELPSVMKNLKARIAILAVPSDVAQKVADLALASGARAIWNFAPAHLEVGEGIIVENVNLASSLAVLSHRLNQQLENKEE